MNKKTEGALALYGEHNRTVEKKYPQTKRVNGRKVSKPYYKEQLRVN